MIAKGFSGALCLACLLCCRTSTYAAQGGGFTLGGLLGEYYSNTNLAGTPQFTRREVRLDFDWNSLPPGGAGHMGDLAFRSVPATNFSVCWTGQLVARFTEDYAFKALAHDSFRLRLKPAGTASWTNVIDQPTYPGTTSTGTFPLQAGATYDIEATLIHGEGAWAARLLWSSPSTPEEVIDPLIQVGINNPDWSAGFADIVKGARNSWEPFNGQPRPALDTNGWPMGDAAYVFQESLNQGMDLDPLMRGRMSFSFHGKATVSIQGNARSLAYQYDAAQNLTTGSFMGASNGWNASYIQFANTRRDGQPGGSPGITDLRLMRPLAPDATASYDPTNALFSSHLLAAMSRFTVIRHQLVANQQRDWAERTRPAYFNQAGGAQSQKHYPTAPDHTSDNGPAWETKILLANETGRDLMLSLPTLISGRTAADTASYVWKLANLIRYGSDGVEPYTSPTADPVYPPLNPNLRVYLELENELWNWASVFYVDFANVNLMTADDADAKNADFQAINFDGLPTTKDSSGNYTSMGTWRYRKIMLRLIQISDIFRSVFGDTAMNTRIRPLYEWQYDNANDTAHLGLSFADLYFNNGDGQAHVANPQPIQHWLWGGGGANYYGAVNGNGLTTLLADPSFAQPALPQPGYLPGPTGSTWSFTGSAGIARSGGTNDGIPPAWHGSQMGYITDKGSISIPVTFSAYSTSSVFGVSFKALNRTPAGATNPDKQNLRVYLDGTNDITARTFSQGNGYTPAAYDASSPWYANNVFWTRSEYYFTRSFTAQPGSTHTITLRGMGDPGNAAATNQTAFLGEVRVTSVDRIFGDGMPGGGEATGQPVGQNLQQIMNVEASWARAFGLEQLSYESGWSLGGDDGGSWVQLQAKYGDTRTADVQGRFLDMFQRSGSTVDVLGTYAQWPNWADYYAEQGLVNVDQYPIVQGILDRGSRLPTEPSNGVLLPATVVPFNATLADHGSASSGTISTAGGWLNWNIIAPRAGQYSILMTPASTNNPAGLLLLDNTPAAAPGQWSASVFLTKGLHSLKLRSISSAPFQVQRITISAAGAPAAPTLLSAVDGDGQVSLSWSAVAGATSYEVRYGTAPGVYSEVVEAGSATSLTITGLTNNQQYYFAVLAANSAGLSLPSAGKGVIPLGAGQAGTLALWEFDGATGNEAVSPPSSSSSRLVVSSLNRGAGLSPSQSDWAAYWRANHFASEPSAGAGHTYGTTLDDAIAKGRYYEFRVAPAAGQLLSLSQVAFRAFFQNDTGAAALTYSVDGTTFFRVLPTAGAPNNPGNPWLIDLAGQTALQNVSAAVTIRIYTYGANPYAVSGLGDASGPDIVVTGSLLALTEVLSIAPAANQSVTLTWPTNGLKPDLETRPSLDPTVSWQSLTNQALLQSNQWILSLPAAATNQFFRAAPAF